MLFWSQIVDVIRESMFAYAQISNGNIAYGIMVVTFLARLALLPLTIRLAKSAAVQQEAMRRAAPELEVRDLSRPDVALAVLVAAVTAGSMAAAPQPDVPAQQRQLLLVLPALFTLIALWQMAAGIGLYWGVSSIVGIAQGVIVRRAVTRRA